MPQEQAKRCKGCGAPLLSAFERSQAKCTRCLHAARAGEQVKPEPATNKRNVEPPEVYQPTPTGETEVYLDPQANCVPVSCKVSRETHQRMLKRIGKTSETLSSWLRALIEREVYQD